MCIRLKPSSNYIYRHISIVNNMAEHSFAYMPTTTKIRLSHRISTYRRHICEDKTIFPVYTHVFQFNIFFFIRQHEVPPGKHALITVRQPKGNLVWIQTQTSSTKKNEKEKFTPRIRTWDECSNVQVIYRRVFVCFITFFRFFGK